MPSLRNSATSSADDGTSQEPPSDWTLERLAYGWVGRFRAMASPCEVHVGGVGRRKAEGIVAVVCAEARRIEKKFSRYLDGNIVHRINTAAGESVEVDEETGRLLDYAAELYLLSDGRFDITSGVMRRAWTFDGGQAVPSAESIERLKSNVGWGKVTWAKPCLTMPAGMEIDLGGIGKEYAVDRAADLVRDRVSQCLINFGGDLISIGPPEGRSGRAGGWTVGIESLDGPSAARRISLERGALATSGDTRRFLLKDGKRYGHILDARTGWPVSGAPRSVTVLAPNCTQAGMLATFSMLMGSDAESFLQSQGVRFWCLR